MADNAATIAQEAGEDIEEVVVEASEEGDEDFDRIIPTAEVVVDEETAPAIVFMPNLSTMIPDRLC